MRYTIKNIKTDQVEDVIQLIAESNDFAHASNENESKEYDYSTVIDFFSEDSKESDDIIESILPEDFLI